MIDVYVYYKVLETDAVAMQALALELQAHLLLHYGVAGQLKRRPERVDGRQTWMEVYPRAPDDFTATLERAVQHTGLLTKLPTTGARHTEIFTDISSCA